MNPPLVSIITVVYNGEKHIEQTIKSVLKQTYSTIEYIIIDGNSTDNTLGIINRYKTRITTLVSEKDTGIYNAMNKGISLAHGKIIAILNADDYYFDDTIEKVVLQFKNTNADIIYGKINKLRTINEQDFFKEATPDFSLIEETMPIFHPATFVKKHVYNTVGNFNEKYKMSADYDFIYKAYKANYKFEYLPQPLTVFRLDGASNTGCQSYREGFLILQSYGSPHAKKMKQLITKCIIKTISRKIFTLFLRLFTLEKWNEKRLHKKWL